MELVLWTVLLGLVFDYTNGAHDAANVVSTSIATRALPPFVAIIMASCFNFLGATQISGVAHTITSGIIEATAASEWMIVAAVVGAIVWNVCTWYFGIPSSSSFALVGGLVGAAWVEGGREIILWRSLLQKVIVPMIVSPIVGFGVALLVMRFFLYPFSPDSKYFKYLQIGTSGCLALAHGLNDAQKSMGIITLGLFAAHLIPSPRIPLWVIAACAITMGIGTATGGIRIIRTMGFSITKLYPAQGFAAEASASLIILMASFLGMPLSSTHIIVGSITGVGAAKGYRSVQWQTMRKLLWAWLWTIPGSASVSGLCWKLFHLL